MAQVSATDVFDFMGTPTDVRNTQSSQISDLITRVIQQIEQEIGRKIEKETITDELFEDGDGCDITGQY